MFSKIKKLINLIKNPFYLSFLLKHGVAAGLEHESILKSLDLCTLIDVGANRGQFALVSRHCFPDAKIDSFEPLKEPAEIYERVFENDSNTQLHHYAVGPEKADAIIHVSSRDDSSSLLPIAEGQTTLFPETVEKETRTIQVVPLDEILSEDGIQSPALLKIDVQGFELSTLQGCSSLLHKFKHVYVECSFVELYVGQSFADEIIKYLADHAFRLIGAYNMHYDQNGKAIQADFLFEKLADDLGLQNE